MTQRTDIDPSVASVRAIIDHALTSVHPDVLIPAHVHRIGARFVVNDSEYDLDRFRRVVVVGFGKAASTMAAVVERVLGDRLTCGMVVTKDGYACPTHRIEVLQAGHPIPDERTLSASRRIIDLCRDASHEDLVLCLVSGGGSSLFDQLPDGISLDDLRRTNEVLLHSGAVISEINTVRRRLSLVKGGQWLRMLAPACCISLILSDVPGDHMADVASGPTSPFNMNGPTASEVVVRYGIADLIPPAVLQRLMEPEQAMHGSSSERNAWCHLIGSNQDALRAARNAAMQAGFQVVLVQESLSGEAREAGARLGKIILEIAGRGEAFGQKVCVIAGGETTVSVRGKGTGGRNQELAVGALVTIQDRVEAYAIASCGTDGTDGPTDAAGGLVTRSTWNEIVRRGLRPEDALRSNDTYPFLASVNGLLKTGPTGTNVMDLVVAAITPRESR